MNKDSGKVKVTDIVAVLGLILAFFSTGIGIFNQQKADENQKKTEENETALRKTEMEFKEYQLALSNPLLSLKFRNRSDESFFGIVVENDGQSAAIVRTVILATGDGGLGFANEEGWDNIFGSLDLQLDKGQFRVTHIEENTTISSGGQLQLVGVDRKFRNTYTENAVEKIGDYLKVGICYCAVYGNECFTETSPGIDYDVCERKEIK